MKFESIFDEELGKYEIHFSKKTGMFKVRFLDLPPEYEDDEKPNALTYDDIKRQIAAFKDTVQARTSFDRKLLVIYYRSSSVNVPSEFSKEWRITHGNGLVLDYAVVNRYSTKWKRMIGRKERDKKKPYATPEPIYEWRKKFKYEIVVGEKIKHGRIAGRRLQSNVDFEHWHRSDMMRKEMDYTEEGEEFIKQTIKSLNDMINTVDEFFNVDIKQLEQNIKTTVKLLI